MEACIVHVLHGLMTVSKSPYALEHGSLLCLAVGWAYRHETQSHNLRKRMLGLPLCWSLQMCVALNTLTVFGMNPWKFVVHLFDQ